MAKSNEPIVWSLFSAGGAISAFLVPILIVLTGLIAPAGGLSYSRLQPILASPLVRIVVFGLAFLGFFHWAHRFRFTLVDVGLKALKFPIAVACYGAAIAGTLWAAYVLVF